MADRDKDEGALMNAVAQWVEKAEYDIETARAMYRTKRYFYVPFCCQQAIEKMLKAIVLRKTGELAPRIHNLVRLSELAGIQLDDARQEYFRDLVNDYILSRYPGEVSDNDIDRHDAKLQLEETKKVLKWLRSEIT